MPTKREDIKARTSGAIVTQDLGDDSLLWKVRRLSPTDATKCGAALRYALSQVKPEGPEVDEEIAAAKRDAAGLEPDLWVEIANVSEELACVAVYEVSSDGGETWEKVEIVGAKAEEGEGQIRVSIFDFPTLQLVVLYASQGILQDAARVRPFRSGPGVSESDRPGREAVRDAAK